jgi:SNF2 family DNA or RNA helicase
MVINKEIDVIFQSHNDEDYELISNATKDEFDPYAFFILKKRVEDITKQYDSDINELKCLNEIRNKLTELPFQIDGAIKILRDFHGKVILADHVGLGKTIIAGYVLKELITRKIAKNALIIVPAALFDTNKWHEEMSSKFDISLENVNNYSTNWEEGFYVAKIDTIKKRLKDDRDPIYKIPWDLVIVDEAHRLRNKNLGWKFVDKLEKRRFLMLTATPFQNDLMELYTMVQLLRRGHFLSRKQFKQTYCGRDKRIPINRAVLQAKLKEIMIRRTRAEVDLKVNKREPHIYEVNIEDSKEKEFHERIIKFLLNDLEYVGYGQNINPSFFLPKIISSSSAAKDSLYNLATGNQYTYESRQKAMRLYDDYCAYFRSGVTDKKTETLLSIIDKINKSDPQAKILIYADHPATRAQIEQKLKSYSIILFDENHRAQIMKKFREEKQILIGGESAAEGIDFEFCHHLINFDLPWNPMKVEQRIGRMDRIGQEHTMHIYSLATKNTIEEHIVDLLITKICCFGLVMNEIPEIIVNWSLPEESDGKKQSIQDRLLTTFIQRKGNLQYFKEECEKIGEEFEAVAKEYKDIEKNNKRLFGEEDE